MHEFATKGQPKLDFRIDMLDVTVLATVQGNDLFRQSTSEPGFAIMQSPLFLQYFGSCRLFFLTSPLPLSLFCHTQLYFCSGEEGAMNVDKVPCFTGVPRLRIFSSSIHSSREIWQQAISKAGGKEWLLGQYSLLERFLLFIRETAVGQIETSHLLDFNRELLDECHYLYNAQQHQIVNEGTHKIQQTV